MPDLHDWITQQVARVERRARQARDDIPALLASGDIGTRAAEQHIRTHDPAAVLRRCEADRRILARHNVDPAQAGSPWSATACEGCGTFGDCDDPYVENLNDCPELLDLGHAHGLTPEILAGLDRPVPPELPDRRRAAGVSAVDAALRYFLTGVLPVSTPMSEVPAALRGPNWRP
ncbi:DUF6221 family protein [Streptomyces sp. NPDC016845]|uniref:DUF6221 family protein n=1 Tax=Streptomyces sp. NPDC016845 TaxID=3364972 RepID=UPI00379F505C